MQDAGADPNIVDNQECSALYYASGVGHAEAVEHLLARGALCTPNFQGQTPLYISWEVGHLAVVNLLLSGPSGQQAVR